MSKKPQTTAQKERASTTAKKTAMLAELAATYGVVSTALSRLNDPKRIGGAVELGARTYYDWLKKDAKFAAEVELTAKQMHGQRLDLGESSLLRLVGGFSVPEQRVMMSTEITTTTSIDEKTGKPVKTVRKVSRPEVVNITKHYGPEPRSVEFLLETQGRERGYDKKVTVKIPGLAKLTRVKSTTKPARNPAESTLTVTKSPRSSAA